MMHYVAACLLRTSMLSLVVVVVVALSGCQVGNHEQAPRLQDQEDIVSKHGRMGDYGSDQWNIPGSRNPILPGYYADPSVIEFEGRYYVYVTLDPWGGETLGCWSSEDWVDWTYHVLNWPTKQACTSATSQGAMVWAPSAVQGPDGRFYMHVSVGSEIWVGIAEHPTGPWQNPLKDENGQPRPMINADFDRMYHMIDAQVLVDDDGRSYMYWGAGWNWVNGACFVGELNHDMTDFVSEIKNVTPDHYFEAPFVYKTQGPEGPRYLLTYSDGRTDQDTYQIHYAVGDHPMGPFVEAGNSPILVTDVDRNVVSPGHHSIVAVAGKPYVLYHRHEVPFVPGTIHRQVCMDELLVNDQGLLEKIVPTHRGPQPLQKPRGGSVFSDLLANGQASVSVSSEATGSKALSAFDDVYATGWTPQSGDLVPYLTIDLGESVAIKEHALRFEYAWKPYSFVLEASDDARVWRTVADYEEKPAKGSPVLIRQAKPARHLRLRFFEIDQDAKRMLLEWSAE